MFEDYDKLKKFIGITFFIFFVFLLFLLWYDYNQPHFEYLHAKKDDNIKFKLIDLSYKVSDEFELTDDYEKNYERNFNLKNDNYNCNISINRCASSSSSRYKEYVEKAQNSEVKLINNREWFYRDISYNQKLIYDYYYFDDKNLYLINIYSDFKSYDYCSSHFDNFINSLKID